MRISETTTRENTTNQTYSTDWKKLPIGSANIEEVAILPFYADKTSYIANWLIDTTQRIFLIRPRRFGKSLLIDTIDKIAQGNTYRALFQKCDICNQSFKKTSGEALEYHWKKYPVIRLDFSALAKKNAETLEKSLIKALYKVARYYGIDTKIDTPQADSNVGDYLLDLVTELTNICGDYEDKIVVLIDEYDAPLISSQPLGFMDKEAFQATLLKEYEAKKEIIACFLQALKAHQTSCQLIFMTGVTKFSLSDLGSGPNIFDDISLRDDFSEILGYTEEDIERFYPRFSTLATARQVDTKQPCTKENIIEAVKKQYNGYRFAAKGKPLYNPDAILKFAATGKLKDYWYQTGDPTILLNQIKQNANRFDRDWDETFEVTEDELILSKSKNAEIALIPLMYQTGYLTIDQYDYNTQSYSLRFPNEQTKTSLKKHLARFVEELQEEKGSAAHTTVIDYFRKEKWIDLLNTFRHSCLANGNFRTLNLEITFQDALQYFLQGAFSTGLDRPSLSIEKENNIGRLDIVIDDASYGTIYVMELKRNKSAGEALKQIRARAYSDPYRGKYNRIISIGLHCVDNEKSAHHRNIDSCHILVERQQSETQYIQEAIASFTYNTIERSFKSAQTEAPKVQP